MAGIHRDTTMPERQRGKEMSGNANNDGGRSGGPWRIDAWTAAGLILMVPFLAMQFTDEVMWDVADFAFFGALLVGAVLAYERVPTKTGNAAYRAAVGVALTAAFILVWMNLAVGLIGTEDDPANLMYGGVLAIGIIGASIARFQPDGMALALFATALAQALVAVIALIGGLGSPSSGPVEILLVNTFFVVLFVGSALLFMEAARGDPNRVV